jgi:hypothetical protein
MVGNAPAHEIRLGGLLWNTDQIAGCKRAVSEAVIQFAETKSFSDTPSDVVMSEYLL